MKEIAFMCGVSRGTVDRVLNNRGGVKPETESHIRAVAKTMGYRALPLIDQSVATLHPMKIGVLINAIEHPYFAEILSGIIHSIEELGDYNISGIVKMSGGFDVDQQLRFLDDFEQQGVNAIAITPSNNPRVAERLNALSAGGVPVVVISALLNDFEPFCFVGCNHYKSGRIAASFASQIVPPGSKIAVVTGSNTMPGLVLRYNGFMDVLHSIDKTYTVLEPLQTFDDDVIAYKSLSGLVSRHNDIDLFFFAAGGYNGCFQALSDANLFGKARIISFDTLDMNLNYLRKGVVSALFSQHPVAQGEIAVKILSNYLLSNTVPPARQHYIPLEILVPESL